VLCQKEIEGELLVHLKVFHNYDLVYHVKYGGHYDIENNGLLDEAIPRDVDKEMSD